eukprot:scaffold27038_cov234-Skeletonema_menzelii.AAC.1
MRCCSCCIDPDPPFTGRFYSSIVGIALAKGEALHRSSFQAKNETSLSFSFSFQLLWKFRVLTRGECLVLHPCEKDPSHQKSEPKPRTADVNHVNNPPLQQPEASRVAHYSQCDK